MPEIRVFPSDDVAFCAAVRSRLAGIDWSSPEAPVGTAAGCLAELRSEYPLLRIRVQHPLARLPGALVLYVFRDGNALPVTDRGPGAMRRRSEVATAVIEATHLVKRSEALLADASRTSTRARVALDRSRKDPRVA